MRDGGGTEKTTELLASGACVRLEIMFFGEKFIGFIGISFMKEAGIKVFLAARNL